MTTINEIQGTGIFPDTPCVKECEYLDVYEQCREIACGLEGATNLILCDSATLILLRCFTCLHFEPRDNFKER